jgi:two-component system sensor histidine kinase EvgS
MAHDFFQSSGLSKNNPLILADSLPDTLIKLSAGKGDVALMPKLVGLIQMRQLELTNLKLSPLVVDAYNRPFSFAVQKGDHILLDKLNQGIAILKSTGQNHRIYDTWFGGLEPRRISIQTVIAYAIAGIIGFLIIGMVPLIWSIVLKKQVKSRTKALEEEIKERQSSEEALRASESRYAMTLDAVNDGIWDWDVTSGKAFFSARYYVMLGHDNAEFTASYATWRQMVHPEDIERVETDLRGSIESGKGFNIDLRMNMKSGEWLWVCKRGKAVEWDSGGKALRMAGTLSDITERKKTEEEQLKFQDLLSHAQKMESIGRLAGGVAHDINNMLSIIMGNAEIALDSLDPSDPNKENMEEILSASKRSTLVARQLLAFARKQTIAPKVLDLNETIADILKMIGRLIGEGIHLQWKPGNDLWHVKMDTSQIDQLLANLTINARDAIGDVGRVIIDTANIQLDEAYCKTHGDYIPGDYVVLSVSDDGCGMDKETRDNVFEPFYTTKDLGKGTGLGLATVYGIVKQNKGFVTVYSEPDQGSTFRIFIPRFLSDEMPDVKITESIRPPTGTETVLMVEDEQSILKLGKAMLKRLGYTVLSANTPSQALEIAESHEGEIHLLLTDVIMPEMNGSVLVNHLLKLKPEIKHLFMSGYTANVIAHHGVLEEGIHFIQKPFSLRDLSIKIREALE